MAGDVVKSSAVLLLGVSAERHYSTSKSATAPSAKTLQVMLLKTQDRF